MTSNVNSPLVTVVTPVFNGAEHLRECIESVLAQTYRRWNYVIVDNTSTDQTFNIASEYAAKDPRIRVQRNDKFVRAIENYNIALRQIDPESTYCKVVAADDWMFPECLERMVALAEADPTVAIVGAYQLAGTGVAFEGLPYPTSVISGRDVCRMQLLGGPYVLGTPTAVLYRSEIVRSRHRFFNESNIHADDEACLAVLQHGDFGFVHQILTFRRLQEGSLTSVSERLNTYTPNLLHLLVMYGSRYLTPTEKTRRIDEVLREYYRTLAANLLKGRGEEFWRYHRGKLAELGYPLNRRRLVTAAMALAVDCVCNPKASLELALSRFGSRSRVQARRPPAAGSRSKQLHVWPRQVL